MLLVLFARSVACPLATVDAVNGPSFPGSRPPKARPPTFRGGHPAPDRVYGPSARLVAAHRWGPQAASRIPRRAFLLAGAAVLAGFMHAPSWHGSYLPPAGGKPGSANCPAAPTQVAREVRTRASR
jgi:hypothetical protein